MPITADGYVDYSIPLEIKAQIPKMFYQALFGELVSVYGFSWLIPNDEFCIKFKKDPINGYIKTLSEYIFNRNGTAGWYTVFVQTCTKLSMEWLIEYENSLSWYDSDLFYNELSEEMIRIFCIAKHEPTNEYYKHLANKQNEAKTNSQK